MGNDQPHRSRPKRRRPRGQSPDGTPVVRLDIYASSEGAGARQLPGLPQAPPVLDTGELDRRTAELDEREQALANRARALDEREDSLAAQGRELAERERSALNHHAELDGREQALADRETELAQVRAAEIDIADIERRRRRLAAQEEALTERTHEARRLEQKLEEREAKLDEREAHIRLELDLNEDELEGREQAVTDHEERLVRKERELTTYVGQLQGRLTVAKSA